MDSKRVTRWISARLSSSQERVKGYTSFWGFFFFTANFCFVQRCGKRVKLIRDLVRDVVGTAPYEKRMMELLKTGRDKRALKLSKRKVSEILSNISVGLSTRKVNLCVLMRC